MLWLVYFYSENHLLNFREIQQSGQNPNLPQRYEKWELKLENENSKSESADPGNPRNPYYPGFDVLWLLYFSSQNH